MDPIDFELSSSSDQIQNDTRYPVDKDEIASEAGYKLGRFSYEQEAARYNSLYSTTSHLMTYVSVESIALITLLPTLLNCAELSNCHVVLCYLFVFGFLIGTLMTSLIARLRFSYTALANPMEYGDLVKSKYSEFESKADGAYFFCNCIEESYVSIRKKNDRISSIVGIANVFAILSLVMVIISVISLLSSLIN